MVQHNKLPSFDRVAAEGIDVRVPEDLDSGCADLNIGFLNMMPDAAMAATERQFLRLLGSSEKVNAYVHPFSIAGIERSLQAQEYIQQYYLHFDHLTAEKLDAMVITGANVMQPVLTNESFWTGLKDVLIWSRDHVKSTVCSCLATHAAVKVFYDINRKHLGDKCWGVFEHKLANQPNALTRDVQEQIKMCHSRFNDISLQDFTSQNIDCLIVSNTAGVQLAAEKDLSMVYFQGHPEYDDISLLKEYKREIFLYLAGNRKEYPPVPENYFDNKSLSIADSYKTWLVDQQPKIELIEQFPEAELEQGIENPWQQSATAVFKNWIESLAH
ncbi:MAG: homoserine O-succinyltransferase [Pseudomonadota bacterium]